ANWNIVAANAQLNLKTNDPFAAALPPQTLTAGTTIFQMVFAKKTLGFNSGWTVTASTTSGSATTLAAGTSALIPVDAGPAAKLQVLLPNQTQDQGNVSNRGRNGVPTAQVAGAS